MKKDLTYEEAFAELSSIASSMENESISMDQLADQVRKAAELIEFCQNKLRKTEGEVTAILAQMESRQKEGKGKDIPEGN
ncbi:MAG: exodeoxyribonuclease VII small subunit [Chitinophagaceae bacterium]